MSVLALSSRGSRPSSGIPYSLKIESLRHALNHCMPVIGCNTVLYGTPALCMALHGAGGAPALCMALYGTGGALALSMALYGAGGATGIPGAPEKAIGAPGSMLIGLCMTGGKLGAVRSKGAVVLDKCSRFWCDAQRWCMSTGNQLGA